MPESTKRKEASKPDKHVPKGTKRSIEDAQEVAKRAAARREQIAKEGDGRSPRWWAPTMVTLMVVGLLFVIIAYIFGGRYPIPGLSNLNVNLFVGFGIMIVGFLMTMKWK
ncbi:MAG: cell division protein CrgA [Actinomycetaceae bacterium]|nr:cell division protein CrgA [Actinomycetaceae bacterium]